MFSNYSPFIMINRIINSSTSTTPVLFRSRTVEIVDMDLLPTPPSPEGLDYSPNGAQIFKLDKRFKEVFNNLPEDYSFIGESPEWASVSSKL